MLVSHDDNPRASRTLPAKVRLKVGENVWFLDPFLRLMEFLDDVGHSRAWRLPPQPRPSTCVEPGEQMKGAHARR